MISLGHDCKFHFNPSVHIDANQFRGGGRERAKYTNEKLDSKRKRAVADYDPAIISIFRNKIENLRSRCNAAVLSISNNEMREQLRVYKFCLFTRIKVSIRLICETFFQHL